MDVFVNILEKVNEVFDNYFYETLLHKNPPSPPPLPLKCRQIISVLASNMPRFISFGLAFNNHLENPLWISSNMFQTLIYGIALLDCMLFQLRHTSYKPFRNNSRFYSNTSHPVVTKRFTNDCHECTCSLECSKS